MTWTGTELDVFMTLVGTERGVVVTLVGTERGVFVTLAGIEQHRINNNRCRYILEGPSFLFSKKSTYRHVLSRRAP